MRVEGEISPRGISLQYGQHSEDPMLFVLTLSPEYVSRQTGKSIDELYYFGLRGYAEQNAETLRQIAFDSMQKGCDSEILR
jgi:hypothetical protein